MPRRRATRAAPAAAAPRGALWASLALSAAGIVVAVLLTRVHAQAYAGITSFCAINDFVNCDRVATSRYSVFLGLPVSVWGLLGYALAAALATSGLARREPSGWPAGALLAVGAVATGASIVLALVSELAIGALCLLCAASWLISFALLVSARRACKGRGVADSIRADLAYLRARPGWVAGAVVVALAAVVVTAAAYPRYWERPHRAPGASPIVAAGGGTARAAGAGDGGAATGRTVVVEYSDYLCPFCARAHEQVRELLRRRPDIELVHRQFPLDASCNPAVKHTVHPGSCELARAGICAQEQGRSAEMDDALFRNQQDEPPPVTLAGQLGLDVPRFRACMASPETARRLASDVEDGIRAGVRATPSYVVGGVVRAGEFPLDLLPPRPKGEAVNGR